MTADQGADERRVAHLLRLRGVGPDAVATPVRPAPPAEPEGNADWLDRLWASMEADEQTAAAPARGGARLPDWWATKEPLAAAEEEPELLPILTDGRTAAEAMPAGAPEQAAVEAVPIDQAAAAPVPAGPGWWQAAPGYWPHPHWPTLPQPVQRVALSPKTRKGLYHVGAAGAGWLFGLVSLFHGWLVDCGARFSVGGALVLGVGGCLVVAHVVDRRTRHWWPPLAWAARIPLASAVVGVLLYAPGTI